MTGRGSNRESMSPPRSTASKPGEPIVCLAKPTRLREALWNDYKVVSRHRLKESAVAAGREIARKLEVEHTIQRQE
jgi:hypothetical protein